MRDSLLEVALRADIAELAKVLDRLDQFSVEAGVGADDAFKLRLVVDELVNNVIDHGYTDGFGGEIRLTVERRGRRLTVDLEDDATLHDPFLVLTPDLSLDINARPLGGLGVHLVQSLVAEAAYSSADGRNHVRLELDLAEP